MMDPRDRSGHHFSKGPRIGFASLAIVLVAGGAIAGCSDTPERTGSPQEKASTDGALLQPESWCGPGQSTAVNFTRETGETVTICREGDTLTYAYGSLESPEPELVYSGPEVASLGGVARMWSDVDGGLCGRADQGGLGELARARDTNGFVVFSGSTGLFNETAYVFRRDGWEYEVVDTWGRGQTSNTSPDHHESTITVRSPSEQGCLQSVPDTSRTPNQLGSDRGFYFNYCGICPRDYDPDWRSDFSNGFLGEH